MFHHVQIIVQSLIFVFFYVQSLFSSLFLIPYHKFYENFPLLTSTSYIFSFSKNFSNKFFNKKYNRFVILYAIILLSSCIQFSSVASYLNCHSHQDNCFATLISLLEIEIKEKLLWEWKQLKIIEVA